MRRHLALVVALPTVGFIGITAAEASWIFRPSYYSHQPAGAQRVAQYAPVRTPRVRIDPTYQQSAYRHNRSTIRGADGSVDRLHIVETWGAGEAIRPYGEWERPFRPGATPYGPWGNPQGPWTSPFGAWVNPYGLGRLAYPPWGSWYPSPYRPPYAYPYGNPPGNPYGNPQANPQGPSHGGPGGPGP